MDSSSPVGLRRRDAAFHRAVRCARVAGAAPQFTGVAGRCPRIRSRPYTPVTLQQAYLVSSRLDFSHFEEAPHLTSPSQGLTQPHATLHRVCAACADCPEHNLNLIGDICHG
jgi:hypothetical protein